MTPPVQIVRMCKCVVDKSERYLRRLDGNATLLLVLTGISEAGLSGLSSSNDTGLGHQGVGQSRLAVIDVSDDGHVADVPLLVHHGTDFVHSEVHLQTHKLPNEAFSYLICRSGQEKIAFVGTYHLEFDSGDVTMEVIWCKNVVEPIVRLQTANINVIIRFPTHKTFLKWTLNYPATNAHWMAKYSLFYRLEIGRKLTATSTLVKVLTERPS